MNRIVCAAVALGLGLLSTGCAYNSTVAHNSTKVGVYFGDLGIWGSGNTITALAGSRITKVSFVGNSNTVTIESDVTLPHVEFFGNNNTVSIPDILTVRVTLLGQGNKIIRRPMSYDYGAEAESFYLPPEEELPAYTEPAYTDPATAAPPAAVEELPAGESAEEPAGEPPTEQPGSADEPSGTDTQP